jgi:Protein of unknown function (DUF2911)
MKRAILGIVALVLSYTGSAYAQSASGRGEATLALDGGRVSIDYGRPKLKGRDLESLIAVGDEWRMGANDPTTLSTDVALKFGSKVVETGKYVLRAKLIAKDQWHLIIQKEDKSVVADVPLTYQKADNDVEELTIKLDKQGGGGKFSLQWGKLSISTDFQKG